MKRGKAWVVAGLLAAAAVPASVEAQYVFAGGGASIPIGDFKDDGGKTGWMATGGLGYDIPSVKGLFVEAEGLFGSHKYSGGGDAKTTLIAGLGAVGYSFLPDQKVSPYVLAGAGIMAARSTAAGESNTESKFAYSGAAGLGFKLNPTVSLWVEGRLLGTSDAKVIPVTAGVSINFGGSSM